MLIVWSPKQALKYRVLPRKPEQWLQLLRDAEYVVTNSFPMGDVDHSGSVTIADVMSLVNYIIGFKPFPFFLENADMNADRVTNISDVMSVVGVVIQGNPNNAPSYPKNVEKKEAVPAPFRIL